MYAAIQYIILTHVRSYYIDMFDVALATANILWDRDAVSCTSRNSLSGIPDTKQLCLAGSDIGWYNLHHLFKIRNEPVSTMDWQVTHSPCLHNINVTMTTIRWHTQHAPNANIEWCWNNSPTTSSNRSECKGSHGTAKYERTGAHLNAIMMSK